MRDTVNKAIAQYRKLDVQTVVDTATPHQLIDMLIKGACARMKQAQGCIVHGDIEGRTRSDQCCPRYPCWSAGLPRPRSWR